MERERARERERERGGRGRGGGGGEREREKEIGGVEINQYSIKRFVHSSVMVLITSIYQ